MQEQRLFTSNRTKSHIQLHLEVLMPSANDFSNVVNQPKKQRLSLSQSKPVITNQTHGKQIDEKIDLRLPPVIKSEAIYDVIGKGKKHNLDELLKLEPEFKCYLRPVIQDDYNGWAFLAHNLQTSPKKAVYPMVFSLR